jgi:6-phosphogluconolactonase
MANYELLSFATADALARAAAIAWLDQIATANRAGERHCVALSGGRIAQNLFRAVVEQNQTRKVSFDNVHFFWADERCVPPADSESNFKTANELLLAPLRISQANIHRLHGEEPVKVAVQLAERELAGVKQTSADELPALDLIFLGMGEDGHVASLFPGAAENILDISVPFLAVKNSPKPPPMRISMSYKMILAAKNIWILVSGSGKETALRESLSRDGATPLAKVIQRRRTKIFCDLNNFYLSQNR